MDGDKLGMEIAEAVMASNASPEAKSAVSEFYKKIGNAIVDHITQNAEVPDGIAVSTSGGSGATSAPGTVK